ncbi:MAG TPA: ABC transporter permease [Bryobacteraceae bacterium]|nr:ABC transporter permease [Bryobacteraceae bacterium]
MIALWHKLMFLIRRRDFDRELAEEMRQHLDAKIEKLIEAGIPPHEAHYQARRAFGNPVLLRETSLDLWGWEMLRTVFQDLRYGARMMRKNPGFTFVATTTLALGIAVNSSIFSLISGWLLKKPAVADPDRAVAVVSTNPARAVERGRTSAVDFLAWREANHVFADLAAADPFHDFSLTGAGEPERLAGMRVTANYFRMLGIQAFLGRTFLPGEDQAGRDHVVVLAYGLWQRRFASDPGIIGRTVALDGEKYVVIGVLPATFRQIAFLPRLWTPLVLASEDPGPHARDARSLVLFGRLKPSVDVQRARAEMSALARRAEQSHPASEKGWGADVMTLQEYGIEEDVVRPGLVLLMTAVALVLVIACANIANLLLARAAKRQQEIAIRTAIGAGRMRIIRQLLVESLLIALIGGGAGLVGAFWAIPVLRGMLNFNEYIGVFAAEVALDQRVLLFTTVISMGAALLFGLAPAIRVSGADPQSTLRHGGRSGDLKRGWGRNMLVGSEIALAMVLVTGAGLIIKATAEDLGGDYGFDPKRVLTAAVSLTDARYQEPARRYAFFQSVVDKLEALPGVEAAGIANAVPLNAERRTLSIQGQPDVPAAARPYARYFLVSPGQFRVLNIPLVQGRAIRESDDGRAPRVAVINKVFAERFFPGQNPLGRYIRIDHDSPAWSEVVGIVGNIKASYGPKEEDAQVFEPYLQVPTEPEMWLAVRAAGDPNLLARALRSAVWAVNPDQPISSVGTISGIIDQQQGGDYVVDTLLAIFGAMALVLAAVGIYGVVAYAVAQRTHEIGIRMALGAQRGEVLRSVLGKGMLLALVSAAVGLLASAALPTLFAAMIEHFRVHGLAIFVCVPVLLLFVVLIAIYIPASRAARVDPMEALRYE